MFNSAQVQVVVTVLTRPRWCDQCGEDAVVEERTKDSQYEFASYWCEKHKTQKERESHVRIPVCDS